MSLDLELRKFGNIPFVKSTLDSLLTNYKSPNDKISRLIHEGKIIQLKRGMYLVSETIANRPISLEIIANSLYGPSCISLDYALSYHGLIPEKVFKVTSVTTGNKKEYKNSLANFEYYHISSQIFHLGINSFFTRGGNSFLMASKEKSLCDKILLTKNYRINSLRSLKKFLIEDLRIDVDMLRGSDIRIVDEYIKFGHKAESLSFLKIFLKELL